MKIFKTKFQECYIIVPNVFPDKRGVFFEAFNKSKFKDKKLINSFNQDNFSKSKKNVLRGMHFQKKNPQAKFFYVTYGKVMDVVIDLRKNSKTFLKHQKFILSEKNHKQIYIPPGFAHGFLVLSDFAHCHYKCDNYYDPNDDGSILWNDKDINIKWNIKNPIISEKDRKGLNIKDLL
jgi:dTDP-4-dehydrorhamnose 3,5-epimerase